MTTVVLVGAGSIARAHLAGLELLPGVEVAGICDLSPGLAEAAAEEFEIPRSYTDYARMLAEVRPDVVHVTTNPASHYRLACAAIDANAHVFVEKPITLDPAELRSLLAHAKSRQRQVVEDHNCAFQGSVQRVVELARSGHLGAVNHVEVTLNVDLAGAGSRYLESGYRHPSLDLPGGVIGEYLPHFASLLHPFVGAHRSVHMLARRDSRSPFACDEMSALIDAERATASVFVSVRSQPDLFTIRVIGTRMRALAGIWEPLLVTEEMREGARPLVPLRSSVSASRGYAAAALRGLWERLAGRPPVFEGMWSLLRQFYDALARGGPPPISPEEILRVHALAAALVPEHVTCSS